MEALTHSIHADQVRFQTRVTHAEHTVCPKSLCAMHRMQEDVPREHVSAHHCPSDRCLQRGELCPRARGHVCCWVIRLVRMSGSYSVVDEHAPGCRGVGAGRVLVV